MSARHSHAPGHNHPPDHEHLHSHLHDGPHAAVPGQPRDDEDLLADALMEGFDAAEDKASFLRMARIPQHLHGADGSVLRLVDVELRYAYQVATASPAFNADHLVYLPFPANMIRERATMVFVYVSLRERRDVDLREMIRLLEDKE
ncbi:hypothetical protein [Pelagibius sp.]|uniref:hypothetical protein n=1 Tax=Pelagibius sp. TaxID=1931238 RepID=UPI00263343C1|nr:hypothetical protein [Pelagibius sp.]